MNPNEINIVKIKLVEGQKLLYDKAINSPTVAYEVLSDLFRNYDREVVAVINLQTDFKPININIVSIGSLNRSVVEPREVFKSSILSNAASFILAHNHPSGCINASRDDMEITKQLIEVGKLMGIPMQDSIVLGRNHQYLSIRNQNPQLFKAPEKYTNITISHNVREEATYNCEDKKESLKKSLNYDIKIIPAENENSKMIAYAQIIFDGQIKVTSIGITQKEDGTISIHMPQCKTNKTDELGKAIYEDICHPITNEFRRELIEQITEAYNNRLSTKETSIVEDNISLKITASTSLINDENTKSISRVYLNDVFAINNVKLITKKDRTFLKFPSCKKDQKENEPATYESVCFPITKESYKKMLDLVENQYQEKEKQTKSITR